MENNDDISIKLEKQNLIREEIINKGYDSIQFIEYLIQCKGAGGENINLWSLQDLKYAIKDFIELNKSTNPKKENNVENKKEEKSNINPEVTNTIDKPLNKNQIHNAQI